MMRGFKVRRVRWYALLSAVFTAAVLATQAVADGGPAGQWPMAGQNLNNTRSQQQSTLRVGNASRLAVKWTHTMGGDVSSTPALDNGAVYVTDWGEQIPESGNAVSRGGSLTKLDANTGALVWAHKLADYLPSVPNAVSRTGPAVVDNVVYIGDQNGGHVYAINAKTGNKIWVSDAINPGPFTIITQSPIVYNGVVYVGTASAEEGIAADPTYPCCKFRGSISALNATTGQILWTTYTVPENGGVPGGYSGGGVWGSTPALDPKTGTLFISTGNNYSVPDSVAACEDGGGTPADCIDPADHIDAVMALNSKTGAIKWATGVQGFDAWNVGCILGDATNCPHPTGPDFDFGSGPNLMTVKIDGKQRQVVGAGAKSGIYWLMDAATGEVLWGRQVGPGSSLGGLEWGTATDNGRVYVTESDLYQIPYTGGGPSGVAGSYAAIDAANATGAILWQTADPSGDSLDLGAPAVSNGVMFAGSMSGHMYALNAATGEVLWDFQGAGSSNAGPAIGSNGVVYWGNGYEHFFLGSPSRTFYAFSVDGK